MTQGILEFHIEILGSSPRMTGNLEFLELNLEFLRINLEFLRINLEFLEIASVALLPRNDARNSRIP